MNMSKIFYITASNVKKKKQMQVNFHLLVIFQYSLIFTYTKYHVFLAILKEPLRILRKNQKKTKTSKGFKKNIPFFNGKLLVT